MSQQSTAQKGLGKEAWKLLSCLVRRVRQYVESFGQDKLVASRGEGSWAEHGFSLLSSVLLEKFCWECRAVPTRHAGAAARRASGAGRNFVGRERAAREWGFSLLLRARAEAEPLLPAHAGEGFSRLLTSVRAHRHTYTNKVSLALFQPGEVF